VGVCLITGIGGFVGSHLAEYLLDQGWNVFGTLHRDSSNVAPIRDKVSPLRCDIQDRAGVEDTLRETRPDVVGDAVRALRLLVEKGEPGGVYNVCSGMGTKVRSVLEMFLAMASRPIPVEQDAGRFRPVDKPFVVGDNSRLRSLGWAPRVALEQSLAAILDYWRGQG
jgi:GDP-4-dehydro-6-deoxy-D-mannose reductase